VHFCTIAAISEARLQKGTVWVRNCNIERRDEEMVHFGTATSPTQRS
jgi:hypothetical protein